MKIVFMGTPEFASVILEQLIRSGEHEVCAVVTVPDKAVGRGLKLTPSAVKLVAERYGIPILQPVRLREETFLQALSSYGADVFVVIAFRMLPDVVWKMPAKGTINLHASLLPRYRGAAPIQRAIMNGDTETGLTTFFINERIDEGNIILQTSVPIADEETGGELHDALLARGGAMVLETLQRIGNGTCTLHEQMSSEDELPTAPKIFKEDCRISWNRSAKEIHNQIRGLSPYPGAYTMVHRLDGSEAVLLKIFKARIVPKEQDMPAGTIHSDDRQLLLFAAEDACLQVDELQLFGSRRMAVKDFLAGHKGYDKAFCEK